MELQKCRPRSDCSLSALFAYAILSEILVYEILGHLSYSQDNFLLFFFHQNISRILAGIVSMRRFGAKLTKDLVLNDPVITIKVMSSWPVNLLTILLGRLRPLSNKPVLVHSFARN